MDMWNGQAKGRESNHRNIILDMLRDAGSKGVTNIKLKEVTFRFGQSIHTLYQKGYVISTEDLGDGVCNYTLIQEPERELEVNKDKAVDILAQEIDKSYENGIDGQSLIEVIKRLGFDVKRKKGYYSNKHVINN